MSDTQLIKDRVDIVDLVSEYVRLKPAGTSQKGLCPFHNEKTPSFMVNRDRQNWHCFGCSKGGDIFTFIEEIEGMEFVEALRHLAAKAGVALEGRQSEVRQSQKNRLKELLDVSASFYHKFLTTMPAAEQARGYLANRGVSQSSIEQWRLGYIPEQWDLLTQYLLKKGWGIDDLVDSGLTLRRDETAAVSGRGIYDRFRDRIMFPICDAHGTVVGFTGRQLHENKESGKYVNTPQTAVYDKSRVVYGLDKAKRAIKEKGFAVVVEGQMDVISCHAGGMQNVVAVSGTAFTEDQIKLLKRYTDSLSMAFDADAAGESAAMRSIDAAMRAGVRVAVIQIPSGAGGDPDECVRLYPSVWSQAVEKAQDVMQWYFERVFRSYSSDSPRDKQTAADTLLAEISKIQYAVEREHWLAKLSDKLRVDVAALREDMERVRKKQPSSPAHITGSFEAAPAPARPIGMADVLYERLLALLIAHPLLLQSEESLLAGIFLQDKCAGHSTIYEKIKEVYTAVNGSGSEFKSAVADVSALSSWNMLGVLLMRAEKDFLEYSAEDAKKDFDMIAGRLHGLEDASDKKILEEQIAQAEQQGNSERVGELLEAYQKLIRPSS